MKKLFLMLIFLLVFAGCSNNEQKDVVDQNVDSYVDSFIETMVMDYVVFEENEYVVNFYVMGALKKLEDFDKSRIDLDENELGIYLNSLEKTPLNLFKIVISNDFFGLDQTNVINELNLIEAESITSVYDMLNIIYALNVLEIENELKNTFEEYVLDLENNSYSDSDYASQVIIALANKDYDLTSHRNLIIESLSTEGINSWGNNNSASTAIAAMAFLALNENPRDINGIDLISILFDYKLDNAFKWLKEDSEADLSFSTPQAFSAFLLYQEFKKLDERINVFS
ncbi:MAG: hypothetical protein PHT83_01410 [Bacilli bacterium]|nr:hypothetical protein [Bacilli bacterium]